MNAGLEVDRPNWQCGSKLPSCMFVTIGSDCSRIYLYGALILTPVPAFSSIYTVISDGI